MPSPVYETVDTLYTLWYTVGLVNETFALLVDPRDDRPVYGQIAGQIRARIAAGEVPPGTILPPVRAVAADLGINMNTVARAYRMLEEEGFVRIQQRAGVEVVAPSRSASDPDRRERLREELATVLAQLKQAGLSAGELRRWIERELTSLTARR